MASDWENACYKVELVRENPKATDILTLSFSNRPTTFSEIKEKIEEHCSIPTCVQTLRYEGCVVADDASPESLYLQNGDTVQVFYPAKGAIQEIKQAIDWLSKCSSLLSGKGGILSLSEVSTFKNRTAIMFINKDMFKTEEDSTREVNCLYFDYLGGLEILVEFHRNLVETRSRNICDILPLHLFERLCCSVMASFCRNEYLARRIVQCEGLETLIASFLSFPAIAKQVFSKTYGKVILTALCGIYNVVDFTDSMCLEVANDQVIGQCLLVVKSLEEVRWAACLLLCLSRCREAHANLLKPDVIETLVAWDEANRADIKSETVATRSYIGVTIAQLVIPSKYLLTEFPAELLKRMLILFNYAIHDSSAKVIQQFEQTKGLYWATFRPCLECLYEPLHLSEQEIFYEGNFSSQTRMLQNYSVSMLLQYLENSFGRKQHADIIVKESLLDYIVPLPWILPAQYGNRARNVVQEVAKFTRMQPPALASLAKASIAINTCGLHKINNMEYLSVLCHNQL